MRPARWFHLREGRQFGPLELETMRQLVVRGDLGPDSYVWADGMDDWMRARDVPALVPPPELRAAHADLDGWPAA